MGVFTPPTRHNSTVTSRRRRRCVLGIREFDGMVFRPSLIEFQQHATGLHIAYKRPAGVRPDADGVGGDMACAAPVEPPRGRSLAGTAARTLVVVAIRGAELHPVGVGCQRIASVSAVPSHRQPVLTDLITDGEHRVFSRVPQTVGTLDLHTTRALLYIQLYST